MDVKEKFSQLLNAKRLQRELEENFMRTKQGLRYRPDAGPTKIPHVPKKEQEEMRRMRQRDAQRGVSAENEEQPTQDTAPAQKGPQTPPVGGRIPAGAPADFEDYFNAVRGYAARDKFSKQDVLQTLMDLKGGGSIIPWKR